VPIPRTITVTCRHRYHEPFTAGDVPSCRCGTFAVGRCSRCGRAVCGDHSRLRGAARVCDEDIAAEHAADLQRRDERARRAFYDRVQTARALLPELLVALRQAGFPEARPVHVPHGYSTAAMVKRFMNIGLPPRQHTREVFRGWTLVERERPSSETLPGWSAHVMLSTDGQLFEVEHDFTYRSGGPLVETTLTDAEWAAACGTLVKLAYKHRVPVTYAHSEPEYRRPRPS
jgi:hypothetical protein